MISDETRKKMSDSRRKAAAEGRGGMLGKNHSKDTKMKMRESMIGKCHPCPESKKRSQSMRLKGKPWSGHNYYDGQTDAEAYFQSIHPDFETEKCIGTASLGGTKVWIAKWFKIDFFDEATNTVYEIDGSRHLDPLVSAKDERKDDFLRSSGYNVIRYTNNQVLSMAT